MALSNGIHPRSFSGEVNGYLTADIPNLMNIYVNLGVLRRRNRIVVPKIPQNDLSLLLKSVFSKLKRLGQKQDKRGDPAVRYQYNNTLNREKRAAKIAARFFNTSISRLILDTSQLQSITDSKTNFIARVRYNHRKTIIYKRSRIYFRPALSLAISKPLIRSRPSTIPIPIAQKQINSCGKQENDQKHLSRRS